MRSNIRLVEDIVKLIRKYRVVNLDIISSKIGLPKPVIEKIIEKMVEDEVIEVQIVSYEECGKCPIRNLCAFSSKPCEKKLRLYRVTGNLET